MNKYTFYGSGIFKNNKYVIQAATKKEAITKARKEFNYHITVSSFKKVK